MGSIPAMDEDRERLLQIDGSMPRLTAIPPGCAFNPRCPHAFDRCRVERPDLLPAGASRAACWLHARRCERRHERGTETQVSPLVEVNDLAKIFDVSAPWLNRVVERKPRQFVHAVDGVSLRIAARQDAGAGGRIGLRQEHGGAAAGRACTRRRAARCASTARTPRRAARRATRAAPAHADDLPGSVREPEPALEGARHRRRAAARAWLRRGRRARRAQAPTRRRTAAVGRPGGRRHARSFRTSSPAASASASRSPARWPRSPSSWSATSRRRRSTSRCRRRCSTS